MRTTRALTIAAVVVLLAGCGGDDAADPATTEATTAAAPAESETTDAATEEAAGESVTVTAVDYAFEGVPASMVAGTEVELVNDSADEVHEILAIRLPDDEDRSMSELLELPEEEVGPLIEAGLRGVAFVPPEGVEGPPLTSVTLQEPGRYLFLCGLPKDGPPQDIVDAAVAFVNSGQEGGSPEYPQTGPPHFTLGMVAETEVTAG